jgi:hypothetical protein
MMSDKKWTERGEMFFKRRVQPLSSSMPFASKAKADGPTQLEPLFSVQQTFDGEQSRAFELASPLKQWRIEAVLMSHAVPENVEPVSETSPQMPFLVGCIGLFVNLNGYSLLIRDGGEDVLKRTFGLPGNWVHLVVSGGEDGMEMVVDGVQLQTTKICPPLVGRVRVGGGFARRLWAGEFRRFELAGNP